MIMAESGAVGGRRFERCASRAAYPRGRKDTTDNLRDVDAKNTTKLDISHCLLLSSMPTLRKFFVALSFTLLATLSSAVDRPRSLVTAS